MYTHTYTHIYIYINKNNKKYIALLLVVYSLGHVKLLRDPMDYSHQAPLSMGFPR